MGLLEEVEQIWREVGDVKTIEALRRDTSQASVRRPTSTGRVAARRCAQAVPVLRAPENSEAASKADQPARWSHRYLTVDPAWVSP